MQNYNQIHMIRRFVNSEVLRNIFQCFLQCVQNVSDVIKLKWDLSSLSFVLLCGF